MKIFSFFRRYSVQKQRRAELEFNRQMAELNRQAVLIKRQSERLKAEAIQHENNGEHKRAVSAAAAAAHQEKSYLAAINTIQTCKNMHLQAKSQKALKELISACTMMAQTATRDADVDGLLTAQQDFADTMEALEQTRDALDAVQEGFNADADAEVRNEAGEKALAQIMGQMVSEKQPALAQAQPKLAAVQEEENKHREWADDRRRILADLAEPV